MFASVAAAGSSDGQELRQEEFDFICQDGVCWKETGGGWAGERAMGTLRGRQRALGQGRASGATLGSGALAFMGDAWSWGSARSQDRCRL